MDGAKYIASLGTVSIGESKIRLCDSMGEREQDVKGTVTILSQITPQGASLFDIGLVGFELKSSLLQGPATGKSI